jgi:hypothetical protein
MSKKLIPLAMSVLLGVTLVSCSANSKEDNVTKVSANVDEANSDQLSNQNLVADHSEVCPSTEKSKTIDMKDMEFTYFKYEDHICGTLEVKLDVNKDWSTKGSGWFAAGFGSKTMKGSNMFIFVPKTLDLKDTQYNVFSNIGGSVGPTLALDTKPRAETINLLSSSLGKVEFALYSNIIDGLGSTTKIDMIFSHSKAGIDKFGPGHIAVYDRKTLQL